MAALRTSEREFHAQPATARRAFECTSMSVFRGEESLGTVTLSGTFDARR